MSGYKRFSDNSTQNNHSYKLFSDDHTNTNNTIDQLKQSPQELQRQKDSHQQTVQHQFHQQNNMQTTNQILPGDEEFKNKQLELRQKQQELQQARYQSTIPKPQRERPLPPQREPPPQRERPLPPQREPPPQRERPIPPQTSFTESIYLNVPTLLITSPNFFDTHTKKMILKKFKKNNIFFNNSSEAFKFINKNWNKIDKWWNNPKTQDARQLFLDNFFDVKQGHHDDWNEFIKKEYKSLR